MSYGSGTTTKTWNSERDWKIQLDPGKVAEKIDVADTKSNTYGIRRMRTECEITTVCVNDYKPDPVTVDKYIPMGTGPKKYVWEVCGKGGQIKTITANCEGKRVLDAIKEVMSDVIADLPTPSETP